MLVRSRLLVRLSLLVACGLLLAGPAASAETLAAALTGNTLALNKQEMKLGAAQWAEPEKNWRTVGELLKTALPPADAAGQRSGVVLQVSLDAQAPWGALKCLLMASSALGVAQAVVTRPDQTTATLELPGADPKQGEVVPLPLFAGQGAQALTENGGQRLPCTAALLKGLVKQLPKATVSVEAHPGMPAAQVVGVLRDLGEAKAAAVAFLPVTQATAKDETARQEAKTAVDDALRGGLGGGKK
jgi:hypothetical protein